MCSVSVIVERWRGLFLVCRQSFLLISIFILIYSSLPLSAEVREFQKDGIKVIYQIRSFQPGEAFLMEVEAPKTVHTIEGTLFGKDMFFYVDGLSYRAIGGIDFRTSPGDYELNLTVYYEDGETLRLEDSLRVKERVFKTHKITVNKGYVNLNKGNSKRVSKEQKKLKAIFNMVDTESLWDGNFAIPLADVEITSGFGNRRIMNGKRGSPHPGVDLRAKEGTTVYSSNRGRVVFADEFYFSGKTVILNHGMGVYTIYAHLSSIKVKEGQLVEKGNLIGLVGATGRVTGPHLHWGAKVMGSIVVDPLSLKWLMFK